MVKPSTSNADILVGTIRSTNGGPMRTAALLLAVAFVSACRSGQPAPVASAPAQNPAGLSDQEGLRTVRMVLSAQLSRPRGVPYTDLAEVLKSIPTLPAQASPIDAETAALKGYRLRMTVSEDRRHFQTALTPEKGCGKSWFSSEQSVIYVGRVLDCSTN